MQHSKRFLALVSEAKARIAEISAGEVVGAIAAGSELALIDTREDSEWHAAHAAGAIRKMGYRNVYSLAGGWRAWQAAGLPVEQG